MNGYEGNAATKKPIIAEATLSPLKQLFISSIDIIQGQVFPLLRYEVVAKNQYRRAFLFYF